MPEKPTPLVVGLVDGDAENPGLQAALAAKMAHISEYLEKHFLDHVGGVRRIVQQAQSEIIDRLLEAQEQRFVGPLRPFAEGADQRQIFGIGRCRLLRVEIQN